MNASDPTVIVAAKRTPICPAHGALKTLGVSELFCAVLPALLPTALPRSDIDAVILGNALYGGGNPARRAALSAGLNCRSLTLDSQCASGMSAVIAADAQIQSGQSTWVVAGGVESASQRPLRAHNTEPPSFYERPRFVPGDDPDMAVAAARLAQAHQIDQHEQWRYAANSHAKALAHVAARQGLVPTAHVQHDSATRVLSQALCARMPIIAGEAPYCIDISGTALAADAACALLLTRRSRACELELPYCVIDASVEVAAEPNNPAAAINTAYDAIHHAGSHYDRIELMEAFAAQAVFNIASLGLNPDCTNIQGGALARGHAIGASGAVLLCHLFAQLQQGERGLALIASAGGLGAAVALRAEA